jgi:hypothetical protein
MLPKIRFLAMRTIGLAVEVRDLRPLLSVAGVDNSSGTPQVYGGFELTSSAEDLAAQLHALSMSVGTRLVELLPADRAVVRRADAQPRGVAATEAVKLRLLAEGAVIAAIRDRMVNVRVAAGVDLGRWYGPGKATLDSEALKIVEAARLSSKVRERKRLAQAVGAALAGGSAP